MSATSEKIVRDCPPPVEERSFLPPLFKPVIKVWDKLVLELYSWFFVLMLSLNYSLCRRRRMSHNNGIAAEGKLKIISNQAFPKHKFFTPGKEFPCRVRHASAGFMDDAMLLVRSMAIKFSDHQAKSPFDLEMNCGRSLFWSVKNFYEFAKARRAKEGVCYIDYYKKYPGGQSAAQESLVNNPSSYSTLEYFSQTPTLFIGDDGIKRYARYRCIPADGAIESPHNSVEEIGYFMGDQRVEASSKQNRNYLKHEYLDRLKRGPICYRLQIQLMEAKEDESQMIFNSNIHWEEELFPWMELAEVEIERPLSYEKGYMMYFSYHHCPKSLGIIPAKSIYDYNSLNHIRYRSHFAKKVRVWAARIYGIPSPLPDEGPRNVSELDCERLEPIKYKE